MNQVFDILKEYWKPIVGFIFFVVGFILQRTQKKPVKVVDTVREVIAVMAAYFIRIAEEKYGAGNGEIKEAYATELIVEYIQKQFSLSADDAKAYIPLIHCDIKSLFNNLKKVM